MPSIDIDRDAAHRAAADELHKPIYSKGSTPSQLVAWLNDAIYRMLQKISTVPGGWLTATVLFLLLAIAAVVAVHILRRTMRTRRGGDHLLFEAALLTAAQHRATAESCAAEGDWAAAIRHRLRAVARQLEETGVLTAAPGRTANELARDAGAALPHLAGELAQAATAFNDVTYGEQPGTQAAYQLIADLDEHLRSRWQGVAPPSGQPVVAEPWAQVR
ncbi:DUF4129 domain-containing protein [Mycobacterium avium subsp. hominissuis]|uniref:DUF4129 domain-containing protein n=3 Tax=Mycobacterium avium TaxID=1764 RepID=UPI00039264D0|nr:DUF4129 domain-containing protein [Mycobacterium avium]ETA94464.1 membrane protein [Mycobacterium avium 10-5581]ATO61185.1 DUF4129 domain-containing protein [Mycobacterium avium subsp. hominissuis]ATO65744.1 DUF4129 domain-containing protein [Mycobacterium avium subsp. hominissuis]ATO70320.1 DUF4129 domain-containing protein [Mycobacterium avium subsp. hominissuis]MBZ4576404.1 DUF4129 domain-containing protein [Mycobacterium avium subsp. hominissuis]